MNRGIDIKTKEEIAIMKDGGARLGKIKNALRDMVNEGVSAKDVDDMADKLIAKSGGSASFKMVPGYKWATCVNVNDGVVHGIPKAKTIFKKGDVVSVDVGLFYKGFHTDTSFTVALSPDKATEKFLKIGKQALDMAIEEARIGSKIYDISEVIETTLKKNGYTPIRALVGHGVGRELHEDPQIPCFVAGARKSSPTIPEGAALAIEIMYTEGSADVYVDEQDKWTISTRDAKMSALFEETVAVTFDGPIVLTN